MTTMSQAQSAGQAANYHSADSYHMKDGITEVGQWAGKGAEALGLSGDIDHKQFVEVLNGYAPGSLSVEQIKDLEKLNTREGSLRERAEEIEKMPEGEERTAAEAAHKELIDAYNEERKDFHEGVKTGGLHQQLKELKSVLDQNKEHLVTSQEVRAAGEADLREQLGNRIEMLNDILSDNTILDIDRQAATTALSNAERVQDKLDNRKDINRDDLNRAGIEIKEDYIFSEKTAKNGNTYERLDIRAMGEKEIGPERLERSQAFYDAAKEMKEIQGGVKEFKANNEASQLIRDGHDDHGISTHRAGFDMTFSAPKSVSIMALEAGDNQLIDFHNQAYSEAMGYVETMFSQTRGYEDKERVNVNTGNLTMAQFTHYTSRATAQDKVPDPQLHTHSFIMNLTQDGNKWMSLEPQQIFEAQKLAGQIYQHTFANLAKTADAGYGVEWNKHGDNYGFELKGVDKELRDARSSRTAQIDALVTAKEAELGRSLTHEEKDHITLDSRAYKSELNVDELRKDWNESLQDMGYTKEGLIEATRNRTSDRSIAEDPREAVRLAVGSLNNEKAVFSEHELMFEALKFSQGSSSIAEIRSAIRENEKEILTNDTEIFRVGNDRQNDQTTMYASRAMLKAEANIEKTVAEGKGKGALMSSEDFERAYAKVEENKQADGGKNYFQMTEGQEDILRHIATSEDQYIGVVGSAGVGKTTSLERLASVVDVLKDTLGDKFEIHGLAPTNLAAATIERDAGIVSRTVDSFINKPTAATEGKQQVYLVDEASMLDTIKMAKLFDIAEKNGAKVVSIGDPAQLPSVGAGTMYQRMEKTGQMSFAYARESLRQKTDMTKEAVKAYQNVETLAQGLDTLDRAGRLVVNENTDELFKSFVTNLAADYTDAHKASQLPRDERPAEFKEGLDDVAGIVLTNADRNKGNEALRPLLQEAGVIDKENHRINTLESKRLDATDAQFAGSYKVGDTLIAKTSNKSIKGGASHKVSAVNRETNEIKLSWHTKGGQFREKWISANDGTKFDAFENKERDFSVGEKIVFEKTDNSLGIRNNETARISEIREDGKWLVDKSGEQIEIDPKSFPYVNHGYLLSTHKAQGQSISKPHIYADTTKGMLSNELGNVQWTRAKYDLTVYTNDRAKLEQQYMRSQLQENAADRIEVAKFASSDSEKQAERSKAEERTSAKANEQRYNFDDPAGLKAPQYQAESSKQSVADRIENRYAQAARSEIMSIDDHISQLRNEAAEVGKVARAEWQAVDKRLQTRDSRAQHAFSASRASSVEKDIKSGIRYQQLNKVEARVMAKGEINLKSDREFMFGKNMSRGEKDAFVASQARSRAHLDQMVKDHVLIADPNNSERYELAVSRSEYDHYRKNSSSLRDSKEAIAQGPWNAAIGDQLFNQTKNEIDKKLVSGEKWNPKEAIAKIKSEGLYNKDMQEVMERAIARYDRLAKEGLVQKSGGSYKAVNENALRMYSRSSEDRMLSINGEQLNAKDWKDMQKMQKSGSLDKSIMRSTRTSLSSINYDVTSSIRSMLKDVKSRDPLDVAVAGALGVALGLGKVATRGLVGAAYRIGRAAYKGAAKVIERQKLASPEREFDPARAVELATGKERESFDQGLQTAGHIDRSRSVPMMGKPDKEVDPLKNDKPFEATHRTEFDEYNQSGKNVHKSDQLVATNKADVLYNKSVKDVEQTLIDGGTWSARAAAKNLKDHKQLNGTSKETVSRIEARMDRMVEDGVLTKVKGEYKAVSKVAVQNWSGSARDVAGREQGEGRDSHEWKDKALHNNAIIDSEKTFHDKMDEAARLDRIHNQFDRDIDRMKWEERDRSNDDKVKDNNDQEKEKPDHEKNEDQKEHEFKEGKSFDERLDEAAGGKESTDRDDEEKTEREESEERSSSEERAKEDDHEERDDL